MELDEEPEGMASAGGASGLSVSAGLAGVAEAAASRSGASSASRRLEEVKPGRARPCKRPAAAVSLQANAEEEEGEASRVPRLQEQGLWAEGPRAESQGGTEMAAAPAAPSAADVFLKVARRAQHEREARAVASSQPPAQEAEEAQRRHAERPRAREAPCPRAAAGPRSAATKAAARAQGGWQREAPERLVATGEPWDVHGHKIIQSQVCTMEAPPFLVCTACFLYARTPEIAWRGLNGPCKGAEVRAKQGSRAQARADPAKRTSPWSPKQPIEKLHAPDAEVRQQWAHKLGVASQEGSAEARAERAPAAAPGRGGSPAAPVSSPGRSPAHGGSALVMPPIDGLARSYGFRDVAAVRERGCEARSARAAGARASGGPLSRGGAAAGADAARGRSVGPLA